MGEGSVVFVGVSGVSVALLGSLVASSWFQRSLPVVVSPDIISWSADHHALIVDESISPDIISPESMSPDMMVSLSPVIRSMLGLITYGSLMTCTGSLIHIQLSI